MTLCAFIDSHPAVPAWSLDRSATGAREIRLLLVKSLCRPSRHVIVSARAAGHRSGRTDIGVVEPEANIIHAG
jgi:hypothetical protein